MKKQKTFDCCDMPQDVRSTFYDWMASGDGYGNGVYISWHTQMWTQEAEAAGDWGMSIENADKFNRVNNWLLANGMKANEDVLIKHWW